MALPLAARVGFSRGRETESNTGRFEDRGPRGRGRGAERGGGETEKGKESEEGSLRCGVYARRSVNNFRATRRDPKEICVSLSIVRQTRLTLLQRIIDQLRHRKRDREGGSEMGGERDRQRGEEEERETMEGASERAQRTRAWFRAP